MIFTFLKMALNFIEKKISGDGGIRTHELENFLNLHEIYGEAANFLLEPTSCLSIFSTNHNFMAFLCFQKQQIFSTLNRKKIRAALNNFDFFPSKAHLEFTYPT